MYALDLRRHGKSDKPAVGYGLRDLAADVVAFMDAKNIARATVIGHSMGGFVAQQVAVVAPKRVSHLVLVGAGRAIGNFKRIDELRKAVASLSDPVPGSRVSAEHRPYPSGRRVHQSRGGGESATSRARVARDHGGDDRDRRRRLTRSLWNPGPCTSRRERRVHLGGRDSGEPATARREGFGSRHRRVHGVDFRVEDDEVGIDGLRALRAWSRKDGCRRRWLSLGP